MTTNTTTASQPNAAPSVDRNAVLEEAAQVCERYPSSSLEKQCAADIRALKSAAPALPEPAAAQSSIGDDDRIAQLFKAYYNAQSVDEMAKLKTEIIRLIIRAAALAPQPLAEVSAAQDDEPTDREALIACLGDDAVTLLRANLDDEMAQTMREAAAMLEADGVNLAMLGMGAAAAQAVPEGFAVVPVKATAEMIQRGGHMNSEWLNDNAPLGECRYQMPIQSIWNAMLQVAGNPQSAQQTDTTREA